MSSHQTLYNLLRGGTRPFAATPALTFLIAALLFAVIASWPGQSTAVSNSWLVPACALGNDGLAKHDSSDQKCSSDATTADVTGSIKKVDVGKRSEATIGSDTEVY